MHCVMSIGRRVRASTRLTEAAKALATRNYVRGISRLLALSNKRYIDSLLTSIVEAFKKVLKRVAIIAHKLVLAQKKIAEL
jgi:hypothetical protein